MQIGTDKRQNKNLSTALCSKITKPRIFTEESKNSKEAKITKRSHAFKNYARSYNVEIWNYFNSELQLIDTKSAFNNKFAELLNELRGFKFVLTLILVLKPPPENHVMKYSTFYSNSDTEITTNGSETMIYLNQSIAILYQNCKKTLVKVQIGLLIQL